MSGTGGNGDCGRTSGTRDGSVGRRMEVKRSMSVGDGERDGRQVVFYSFLFLRHTDRNGNIMELTENVKCAA